MMKILLLLAVTATTLAKIKFDNDACASERCLNDGTCIRTQDGFVCLCPDGFYGEFCETAEVCASKPCKNGGTCIRRSEEEFICLCPIGYSGTLCETEVKEAENENYCSCENGKCVNNVCVCPPEYGLYKGYCKACDCGKGFNCTFNPGIFLDGKKCICPKGYAEVSKKCQGPCRLNPCTRGSCVDGVDGDYKCNCPAGYLGKKCEIKAADACTPKPCLNGGTCTVAGTKYKCTCKAPFSGDKCEKEGCHCENGNCVTEDGKLKCVCKPEFGLYEEGLCKACDCGKGANCTFDKGIIFDDVYCICPKGYSELNNKCIADDPCRSSPCVNGGTCISNETEFQCKCPPGHSGKLCDIDPCTNNPCKNSGNCTVSGDSFKCECKMPFTGATCEKECKCENGKCLEQDGELKCVCNPEFGPYIEEYCKACSCGSGNNCTFEKGFFTDTTICICAEGYTNEDGTCVPEVCASKPCNNGGTCIRRSEEKFICLCPIGYSGTLCETEIKEAENETFCDSNPCWNGGKCLEGKSGYHCICPSSFYGKFCEEKVAYGSTNVQHFTETYSPSWLTYTATRFPTGSHAYTSSKYFTGGHSTYTSSYTTTKRPTTIGCRCENGYCRYEMGFLRCICNPGYVLQEEGICTEICSKNTCVQGKCEKGVFGFFCKCDDGYSGLYCDKKIGKELNHRIMEIIEIQSPWIILTGLLLLLLVTLVIIHRNKNVKKNTFIFSSSDEKCPLFEDSKFMHRLQTEILE